MARVVLFFAVITFLAVVATTTIEFELRDYLSLPGYLSGAAISYYMATSAYANPFFNDILCSSTRLVSRALDLFVSTIHMTFNHQNLVQATDLFRFSLTRTVACTRQFSAQMTVFARQLYVFLYYLFAIYVFLVSTLRQYVLDITTDPRLVRITVLACNGFTTIAIVYSFYLIYNAVNLAYKAYLGIFSFATFMVGSPGRIYTWLTRRR